MMYIETAYNTTEIYAMIVGFVKRRVNG
jgi:hypothetical protein